ncbi:hypothetical protein V6L77_01100 [Pannonibacter sp. Pt2-lr]
MSDITLSASGARVWRSLRTDWLVLGGLAILVGLLSFAPLARLAMAGLAPDGVPWILTACPRSISRAGC